LEIVAGVHRVPAVIGNVYVLIDPDGLTLIDTGLPYNHRRILNYVTRLGYGAGDVRRILLTHADRDHKGSVPALQALTPARVYASRVEAEAMAQGREARRLRPTAWQKIILQFLRPLFVRARPATADEFLEPGQMLPALGGLCVLATPGHTPGHLSFFAPARGILFAGDSFVAHGGRLRVSDGPNTWNAALAWDSARRQAGLGARVLCAGHGPAILGPEAQFRRLRLLGPADGIA